MDKTKNLRIAYIGGGSRAWARKLMYDLALEKDICGEVRLYDIDLEAAKDNERLGNLISRDPNAISAWKYRAVSEIEQALDGADFVIISILPGTFAEMQSDVHYPEKYGIYQPVGDTVGIGGYVRAMRTLPIYRYFADRIRTVCPDAWVINYTNPMTLCVRALYEEFPKIKAIGCCHEVFGTQNMLIKALAEIEGIHGVTRDEIACDVSGINHFTWLTAARYKDTDLFGVFSALSDRYGGKGFFTSDDEKNNDIMQCGNNIKFEMFKAYGVIPAAGDRHLAEFFPPKWYLSSESYANSKNFALTPVSWRVTDQKKKVALTKALIEGREAIDIQPSGEEGVRQVKALLGLGDFVTNINIPNQGQMSGYPEGAVVESNALLSKDTVKAVSAGKLPPAVNALILRHVYNQEAFIKAVFDKDSAAAKQVIFNDPQCSTLTREQAEAMLDKMIDNTKHFLNYWDKD